MAVRSTPKDRGWSWVILGASFLASFLFGLIYTCGIVYVAWLEAFDGARSTTALVTSIQGALLLLLSPLASVLNTKIGERWLVISGGVCVALGHFLSFFAQGLMHSFLTYGVLSGCGMAMIYLPANAIVGFYFEKYRNAAYGFVTMASGLGTLALSPLIQYLIDQLGWRGTMWIISGISLHFCICGALMRPPVIAEANSQTGSNAQSKSMNEKNSHRESTLTKGRTSYRLKCGKLMEEEIHDNMGSKTQSKSNKSQRGLFDISVLTNVHFDFYCVSIILLLTGTSVVFAHLPALARFHGSTHAQSAALMSYFGAGTLIGRALAGGLISIPRVDISTVHTISCVLSAGSTFLLPIVGGSYIGQVVCTGLISIFSAIFQALMAPLVIELLRLDKLVDGLSIAVFSMGIGCFIGPPTAGWLFDLTGAYHYSFYFSGICFVMAAIAMVPMLYARWHQRGTRNATSGESAGNSGM